VSTIGYMNSSTGYPTETIAIADRQHERRLGQYEADEVCAAATRNDQPGRGVPVEEPHGRAHHE
jgi:hypothetical protein